MASRAGLRRQHGLHGQNNQLKAHVTAASLGNYLYNNMKNYLTPADLADPEIEKEPDLVYDRNAGQAFVFSVVDVPRFPVQIELPAAAPGQILQIRGDGFQVVFEKARPRPPWWSISSAVITRCGSRARARRRCSRSRASLG